MQHPLRPRLACLHVVASVATPSTRMSGLVDALHRLWMAWSRHSEHSPEGALGCVRPHGECASVCVLGRWWVVRKGPPLWVDLPTLVWRWRHSEHSPEGALDALHRRWDGSRFAVLPFASPDLGHDF